MKRLSLFFLLSVAALFGAIGVMDDMARPHAPVPNLGEFKPVMLAVYAPAPKPQPQPQPQPKSAPKPTPKPQPASKPKPKPRPVATPEPAPAPTPRPEPVPEPEPEPVPQPAQHAASMADQTQNYYARLYERINRHKHYPTRAHRFGIEGNVRVAFEIDASGRITRRELEGSSGNRSLDNAALQIFDVIGAFEAPPSALRQRRFEIVIEYTLS